MPKLKTNRSAKKRIRITKSGRAKYFEAGRGHLLTGKNAKRKRNMGNDGYIDSGELKSIHKMLPYGA
jgi:large subunit ribosomal protein L35